MALSVCQIIIHYLRLFVLLPAPYNISLNISILLGSCSNGLNLGTYGTNMKALGMVFLDEKNLWVFFTSSVSVNYATEMVYLT